MRTLRLNRSGDMLAVVGLLLLLLQCSDCFLGTGNLALAATASLTQLHNTRKQGMMHISQADQTSHAKIFAWKGKKTSLQSTEQEDLATAEDACPGGICRPKYYNANNDNKTASTSDSATISASTTTTAKVSILPSGDALDKLILKIALPAVLNFLIGPLVGAADTFWVGRMKNALALAGQGAANQIFNSAYFIFSFLPSVITPLVAKAIGAQDDEAVKDRVGESIFIATIVGIIGTFTLAYNPKWILSLVLRTDSAARVFAEPYLRVRAMTFGFSLLSTVGFAVFRGSMNVMTPLKISLLSNAINVLLDPLFIFPLKMGVVGAALATCISEISAFIFYAKELMSRNLIRVNRLLKPPSWKAMKPLLIGGLSMQLRAIALNTAMIAVTRTAQQLDTSGINAAAHTISMQLYQLGSVAALAMSVTASVIVPMEAARSKREQNPLGLLPARQAADRLLAWGTIIGVVLAGLQLVSLPILSLLSPLQDVQNAARLPSIIGAVLQFINCIVWTAEGIQQGNENFMPLAVATTIGTAGMLVGLKYAGQSLGKVWGSFLILSVVRLIAAVRYHFFSGPLAKVHKQNSSTKSGTAIASIHSRL